MKHEEKFTSDVAASILNSCILLCDVVVVGNDSAIGLKYDEENMFAPMIVLLEKNASADALTLVAENLGVSVINNPLLAKNLVSYGKQGEPIPEASYRDVSLALARPSSPMNRRRKRISGESRLSFPVKIPRPLSMELGASLFALTGEEPGRETLLAQPLNAARKRLMRLLGFSIPFFRVSVNPKLKNDEYRLLFKGIEAGRGRLEMGWYAGEGGAIPDIMNDPENIRNAAKAAASVLIRHADEIIQRRAPELLGRDEIEAILDAAEEKSPVVTGEVKSILSLGIIREILQSLVSEQVSIRHIAVILEILADWGSFGPVPSDFVIEQIRQSLKRQICLEYADDGLTLRVLTLESKLDKSFADHSQGLGEANNSGPMGAERCSTNPCSEEWTELISVAVRGMKEKGYPPVILCSPKARAPVKEATRRRHPDLAVLSYMEIPSDISVEPVGEIQL
jgi:flagellar biosynthesis protein FlhA